MVETLTGQEGWLWFYLSWQGISLALFICYLLAVLTTTPEE